MAVVYQTNNMGEAQLRVALVDRGSADLLVHRVSSRGMAHGTTRWFITRDKQQATVLVYFTSPGMAQLKISFVNTFGETKWRNPRVIRGFS